MAKTQLVVRDVQDDVLRKFKAKTAERGIKMGNAITSAMKKWVPLEQQKPDARLLRSIASSIKTEKKVRWSNSIDGTIYRKHA